MLGQHPDKYLLGPTVERRVLRVRRHWACLLPVLLQTFGVVVVAFVLSQLVRGDLWVVQSVLWYLAIAAVLRLAWRALEWWTELIIVTDKRLMITGGLIMAQISMVPMLKVADVSYWRTVGGRLFGYGTLRVEWAGRKQDLEKSDYLPKPEVIFDVIYDPLFLTSVQKDVAADPVEREHDIFLSHAAADLALALALNHALKELGADVWIDEFNLGLGQNIVRTIDRGIASSESVLSW
jgi:membrane protein YdbS with pleckstrin-like domain